MWSVEHHENVNNLEFQRFYECSLLDVVETVLYLTILFMLEMKDTVLTQPSISPTKSLSAEMLMVTFVSFQSVDKNSVYRQEQRLRKLNLLMNIQWESNG